MGDRSEALVAPLISTYLNDHLAGATVALELVRRTIGSNRGNQYGQTLAEVEIEIAEDRETLKRLMDRLGVGVDRKKTTAAWVGEKVGRLKPNGRLLSYSPLSRLEELEVLSLGIEGKALLWEALARVADGDARLAEFDFDELAERARQQRRRVGRHRLEAAVEALKP